MKVSKRIALPLAILLVGILITAAMIIFKPKASRSERTRTAPTVEVMVVESATLPARVRSTGTVIASEQISLLPEVSGRIVFQSDKLVPGGRFGQGDLIARIDSRDYSLAVQQEESRVRQAELDLQLEQSRQKTAKREWELLGDQRPKSEAALALRKPHLVAAQENLKAAQGNLTRAKLNLSRTTLRAPFNCLVVNEHIDVGQVVGPTSVAATLIGTDRFWIKASVPVDRLGLLQIPGFNAETASRVRIVHDLGGGSKVERQGVMFGLAGQLDPQTRTALLLVVIDNPLDPPAGASPILNGAYVDLEFFGRDVVDAIVVPRLALVEGRKVWVVGPDHRLVSRDVEILWGEADTVAVTGGLKSGDRIVVTPLALPIEGMQVRVQGEDEPESPTENATEDGHAS